MPTRLNKESPKNPARLARTRLVFQVAVLMAVVVTGFRHAMGWSRTSIETFCPFGGLEAAYALVTEAQFTCTTGERNLAIFVGLLVLTLLARKAFCGWVCPIGAVSEWFARLGGRLFGRRRKDQSGAALHALEPSRKVDGALRWLKLPVLVIVLYFTYRTGELVFRGYDPYYILFSFHGHEVKAWSYLILAAVLLGVVVFPMAWCRYLCPLGAVLWPFAKVGRLRLARSGGGCTGCQACNRSCPYALNPAEEEQVVSGDCTLCFKCVSACPKNSLELRLGASGK